MKRTIVLEEDKHYYKSLKDNIVKMLKKQKIECHIQDSFEGVFISFTTTEEFFNVLQNNIQELYNVSISDFTSISYQHYHIDRTRAVGNDDYEYFHESIAYNLKEGYWEVYYQGGDFENFGDQKGSLDSDYGIYIFSVQLNTNDDIQKTLDNAFDTWMQNNS